MLKTMVTWVKRWVSMNWHSDRLGSASTFSASHFLCFFFFFVPAFVDFGRQFSLLWTVYALFTYCAYTVHILKNIKNGSHDTIYTFKYYFTTVFSVFSNNKFNPNTPIVCVWISRVRVHVFSFCIFFFFFFFKPQLLTKSSVNSTFVHCSQTHKLQFSTTFSLKIDPTILFTHLKIILLQCF